MPSLFSQFVPSVSSRANTDFSRCRAVAVEDRKLANGGGSVARAPPGGGAGVRGCVEYPSAAVGGVDVASMRWGGGLTSVAWPLSAAMVFSAGLSVMGGSVSSGSEVPSSTSTLRGVSGVGSTRRVSVGCLAGLTAGQWLTPPACTVLHQGHRTGSAAAVAVGKGRCGVLGSTGATLMAASAGVPGTALAAGFDRATETASSDASGRAARLAEWDTALTCRRSSRSSRCNASFCCEVWCASSSIWRRSFRCLRTAKMARTGAAKTNSANSANNTARSSKAYPVSHSFRKPK